MIQSLMSINSFHDDAKHVHAVHHLVLFVGHLSVITENLKTYNAKRRLEARQAQKKREYTAERQGHWW